MSRWGWVVLGVLLVAAPAAAQTGNCNQPAPDSVLQVSLPGHPFAAIPSADGCTVFVSLTGGGKREPSKVAVLSRGGGKVSLLHVVEAEGELTGMALSPDGRFLAAANGRGVTLFDTARLVSGADKPQLGYLDDGASAGSIYAAFSPDAHLLFVSDERSQSISVYDFPALLSGTNVKMIGQVRTGNAPVGLAFSPDGKLLYSTSEVVSEGAECAGENGGRSHGPGGLMVIDVARAASDPTGAVLARLRAGCNTVRVTLSPKGDVAYVSSRGDNSLLAYDTARLLGDRDHALIASIKVGVSPVGVAVAKGAVFVTNSDRFGGGASQSISVLDAANLAAAQGHIPAGGFPRELRVTADGNTLIATNFGTGSIELVDLARLAEFGGK